MADTPSGELAGKTDAFHVIPSPQRKEDADIASTAGAQGLSLRKQMFKPRSVLSFLISFGIIAFVIARQDIPFSEMWEKIQSSNKWLYASGFLAYYSSFIVRTLRWKQVLHNAGYDDDNAARLPRLPKLTRIIFLSWFANSILPAKLGDGYRGYLLKKASKVSFYKTMGTIFAERVADVGVLFSLLLVSGLLAFRNDMPPNFGTLIGFGAALAVLSLGALFGLRYLGPWIRRLLPSKVRPLYGRLEEGVLLAYRQRMSYLMLLTALVWVLESARFWFVLSALGVSLSIFVVVFVALAASLLTTVPFTPAGLGVVEGAVVAVLVLVSVSKPVAFSAALLDRGITYWSVLLVGAIVYLMSPNH